MKLLYHFNMIRNWLKSISTNLACKQREASQRGSPGLSPTIGNGAGATYQFFEQLPFLTWVCDPDGKMEFVSGRTKKYFGESLDFIKLPTVVRIQALIRRCQMARTKSLQVKMKLMGVGEEKWFLVSIHQILPGDLFLVLALDIHDQVVLEEQANEQKIAVENSARMATVGQLSAGIAHEINNPLAVMTAKAFQVRRRLAGKGFDTEIADLEKIEKTGYRIANIIKGLRSLARDGEKDTLEPVLVSDMMKDVVLMFEEKLRRSQIELITYFAQGLTLTCRSTQISQIILNLVSNAFDAIKDKDSKWIRVEGREVEGFVELTVTDSGNGIPVEVQQKMMTPFFTTKSAGQGTGLGLSISQKIAKDHGGELIYQNSSKNTQFVLRIPTHNLTVKSVV